MMLTDPTNEMLATSAAISELAAALLEAAVLAEFERGGVSVRELARRSGMSRRRVAELVGGLPNGGVMA